MAYKRTAEKQQQQKTNKLKEENMVHLIDISNGKLSAVRGKNV